MGIKVTNLYQNHLDKLKIDNTEFKDAIKSVKFVEYGKDRKKCHMQKDGTIGRNILEG